ncbi:MAG: menaquinol oxidoreductase, partial [Desulfovibrio sp.]|nr:menaquinol oxidoreductase [Desulfovibrio sp.]
MFNSLLLVLLRGAITWGGAAIGLAGLFGVVLPYVAVVVFVAGVAWRMVYWAKSPVPFAIPTTGGQEAS